MARHVYLLIIMADSDRKWHVVAVAIAVISSMSGCTDASALMLRDSLCALLLASEVLSTYQFSHIDGSTVTFSHNGVTVILLAGCTGS